MNTLSSRRREDGFLYRAQSTGLSCGTAKNPQGNSLKEGGFFCSLASKGSVYGRSSAALGGASSVGGAAGRGQVQPALRGLPPPQPAYTSELTSAFPRSATNWGHAS